MVLNPGFSGTVIFCCILMLFSASLALIPLGLWLAELRCLFLEFLGYLLFILGIAASVYFLRIVIGLLHR